MFTVPIVSSPHHIAVGVQTDRSMIVVEPASRSAAKREVQERQREWLREIVRATGQKASQIAVKANVSDTTLTRLLNNPTYRHTLTQITIDRIKRTYGVPGPEEYAVQGRQGMPGFGEAERVVAQHEPQALAHVIDTLVGGRNARDVWRLKTEALTQAGYLAGDIVIVDLNAQAAPQDVVCAQVYNWNQGVAETVFRVYDPPFLVAAALDRTAYKPLLVDNDRVIIKGVVIESFRPHRLSATR
jgi:hypothetical protein